ncbi:MAG: biotin synthase BioB, partial [Advenella sp.]
MDALSLPNSQQAAPNWTVQTILDLYNMPFMDLMFRAQQTHREYHEPNAVQLSSLLSIKTGGCPEDC